MRVRSRAVAAMVDLSVIITIEASKTCIIDPSFNSLHSLNEAMKISKIKKVASTVASD